MSGHTEKQIFTVSCTVLSTRLTQDLILIPDFIKVQVGDKDMHIKITLGSKIFIQTTWHGISSPRDYFFHF